MPFQPIDFARIDPQGNPFLRDFVQNLAAGYKAGQLPQQLERQGEQERLANAMQSLLLQQQPQKFGEESQGRQLENAWRSILNRQQPQKFESEMENDAMQRAFQKAQTGKINTMTPLEARELSLKNQLYPELTRSQIANNLALSKQRELGLTGLGTGGKEEFFYQNLTAKSNPNLNPNQIFEAANAVREGKTTLSDGTKINITPAMISSLDRIAKYGTTGELLSNRKRGEQAEKEVDVLRKYISDAMSPYGDTIAGVSPKQIADTFSNKKADQLNLGKLAGAQQLQVDFAANENILNSGRPTATITREILRDSEAKIKTHWPFMSNVARQESMRYISEALKEAFKARKSVSLGASDINISDNSDNKETKSSNRLKFNPSTGDFE